MSERGAGQRNAGKVFLHLVTGACLLFSIFLVANNIYPTRQRLREMEKEKARLEKEIGERRVEIERMELRSHALANDPVSIERETRRTFKTSPEGERKIRLPGEDE